MNDTTSAAPEAIIDRIEDLLHVRDMTQRVLAQKVGLSTTQMSRLLSNDRKMTATDLAAIADALDTTASHLLGQTDSERPLAIAARLGSAGRPDDLDGPFQRAQDLLRLRDLLDGIFARPNEDDDTTVAVPASGHYGRDGAELAARVRTAFGLGHEPIDDLEGLATKLGLDADVGPMPDTLHGLLVADQRPKQVVGRAAAAVALINGADPLGRRRFTLAHELAHLAFGDTTLFIVDYADGKKTGPAGLIEHRADCFAGHLLAPDAAVRAVGAEVTAKLGQPPAATDDMTAYDKAQVVSTTTEWVATIAGCIASRYGLSVQASAIRAEDAGVITKAQHKLLGQPGWSATRIVSTCGIEDRFGVLDAADATIPPQVMLSQALHAYTDGMLGLRPIGTLYDTNDLGGLEAQLDAAGWAPHKS